MVDTDKLLDSMKPLMKTFAERTILITVAGISDDGDSMAFIVPAGVEGDVAMQSLVVRSVEALAASLVKDKEDIPAALEEVAAKLQHEPPDEIYIVDGRKKAGS